MSVRAKIEDFEERCKGESSKDNKNESAPGKRKRFLYPGKSSTRTRSTEQQESSLTSLPSGFGLSRNNKPSTISGFEADLQDIWSVKKNIHHTGKKLEASNSSSLQSGVQVTAGQYSRHGAIPAHQSQGPQILTNKEPHVKGRSRKDEFTTFGIKRSRLQEPNSKESLWNVRSNTFSYSDTSKPDASPHKSEELSPPTAKRKTNLGTMDVIKPSSERVLYAKKMAQGYLRSEGLGKFTPKVEKYEKTKSASPQPDDFTSLEEKRSPHHEHISKQNTQSNTSSDPTAAGKPEASPHKSEDPFPSTAKRKTSQEAMDTHVAKPKDEKLLYAKRMAQGYLRSEGLGKYTPKEKERSASPETGDFQSPHQGQPEPSPHKSQEAMDTHVEKPKDEKVLYAKRMAQRYLRSEGLGEYAPKGGKEKSASPETDDFKSPHQATNQPEEQTPPTATSLEAMDTHVAKPSNERVLYAKRMAQGYLRSEGLGKYAPKNKGGRREKQDSPEADDARDTKWKKSEGSDEFDF